MNPDPEHRRAIRAFMAPQLARDIRLVQFDRLGQFAPHVADLVAGLR